jgi:class 3 adenylate cyclase
MPAAAVAAAPPASPAAPAAVRPVLPVFRAVIIDGAVKGFLATELRLDGLCATVAEVGERRLGTRDAVLVVDESLALVLAADPARAARRESLAGRGLFAALAPGSFAADFGAAPDFDEDGVPMLGAVETMPDLRWAVVVRQARDVAYRSLGTVRRTVAAAALAAALAALAGGALVARRLARPIAALAAASGDVARRRYRGVGPEVTARGDEIGRLGRAFDRMAHDLDASERRLVEETKARASLSRYLPADVVELVLADPGRLALGGARRDVTVVFADVVAFTRLSETLAPERAVALLNELFTIATEIVHRHGGIVDKFIGDCVMAVWGAPEARADDPVRAVRAAHDLRRWVETANRKWRADLGAEIQIAIGINTGPAVAGNVGSDKRMDYTVIGDTVNVAARLEAMAAPGQILLSDATRARLGEAFALQALGERTLPGRRAPTPVYEVRA